jgi:hypothetical protein
VVFDAGVYYLCSQTEVVSESRQRVDVAEILLVAEAIGQVGDVVVLMAVAIGELN